MGGNKALKRALETKDVIRINADLPLLTDETELVTPDLAREYLKRNKRNRPINWKKVTEYENIMRAGKWALHSQGIIFDAEGNILTGQSRLWAVIHADTAVYMRVSRGNPASVAPLLDRGRPQSARDLATRRTERDHALLEVSLARAISALKGRLRPSTDELAEILTQNSEKSKVVLAETAGRKKGKAEQMILAAVCMIATSPDEVRRLMFHVERLAEKLDEMLAPRGAEQHWGKGLAFTVAMEKARALVEPVAQGLIKKPN